MPVASEPVQFENAGLTLRGERWTGGDSGATVVLLHGGGQTRHSWERTARSLAARGRTAVLLDARGHGDSDWAPDGDYSLGGFVSDLLAFIATLERPPVLVGASLGGMTSLVAVGEHPGVAAGLVLVDIVVDAERRGVEQIIAFMRRHLDGFATLEEVADAVVAYNPHRRRPRNLDGLRKNVRLHDDGRWYWHWDPVFVAVDDEPQRREQRERLRAAARRVTVPTLLVRGLASDVVSDAGMKSMQALIPQAEVAEVRAAGHMVAGDDNDVFASTLEAFLDSIPSPPAAGAPRPPGSLS